MVLLFTADVDASGKVTRFIEMSGEALKFHKPGESFPRSVNRISCQSSTLRLSTRCYFVL